MARKKTECCYEASESDQEVGCCDKSSSTAGQRDCMIAEAAYFRAEKRGFAEGDLVQDWLEAEREIDCMLNEGAPS